MPPTATDTTSPRPGPIHPTAEKALRDAEAKKTQHGREVNVGTFERIGSSLGGTALAVLGLLLLGRRRSILGGISLAATGASLAYRGVTGHCRGYQALGVTKQDASRTSHPLNRFIHVSQRIRVNRPVNELYDYWRDFNNLPGIMQHLKHVEVRDEGRSHWVVAGPRGTVEWDAQITDDRRNELIAWRSTDDADVPNHGHVRFESPDDRHGSILEVSLDYRPPAGVVGAAVAYAFGEAPSQQLHEDLRRFKQLLEAGEITTNQGQPRGRC